jgi:hypothetical protein
MARARHTRKEIEAAVAYAESRGWTFVKAKARAHIWGTLRCPQGDRTGCTAFVHSTPEVPQDHADLIRKKVDRCTHQPRRDDPQ